MVSSQPGPCENALQVISAEYPVHETDAAAARLGDPPGNGGYRYSSPKAPQSSARLAIFIFQKHLI